MIEVKNLTKSFGDFTAVRDLSFTIDKQSGITGLLGPNGAGKTTTMRLLTGYLSPTAGHISVAGVTPKTEDDLVHMKRKIGYLAETTPLYPEMLVSEYLEFIGRVRGLEHQALENAAREMIEKLELGSHLYTPIGILSKGFRQRVALAGTLIHKPEIIILDEPTTGLDPNQITHIRRLIKELGSDAVLVLSTHILQEVEELCERVIVVSRGSVVADESVKNLRGSVAVTAVIRGEGVHKALSALPLVKDCRVLEDPALPEGYVRYVCEMHEDGPEKLFAAIAGAGWETREFAPRARSLQEIFQELTV